MQHMSAAAWLDSPWKIVAAVLALVVMSYFLYFIFFRTRTSEADLTMFASLQTELNDRIRQNVLSMVGHYSPPWWYNSHLASIATFGDIDNTPYDREIVSHDDGFSFRKKHFFLSIG